MGDTFPHTLNAMDLRLFKNETVQVTITQTMQELGRLCRYVDRKEKANEPFAIVGKALYNDLYKHVKSCASFTAIDMIPDAKMAVTKDKRKWEQEKDLPFRVRWLRHEARSSSCDYKNTYDPKGILENRLLLQAEPQIGKTGTYLKFLEDLRSKICRDEDSELIDCGNFDTETEKDEEAFDSEALFDEAEWIYPHYAKFTWETARRLKYELSSSKYEKLRHYNPNEKRSELVKNIINAFYPKLIGRDTRDVAPRRRERSDFVVEWEEEMHNVRSYSDYHAATNCLVCYPARREAHFDLVTLGRKFDKLKDFEIEKVTISVPGGPSFENFRLALKSGSPEALRDFKWVFIPSHKRAHRALLNFSHSLKRGSVFKPLFALVIRQSEFQAYQTVWGKFHVIIQLPTRFKLPEDLQKQLDYKYTHAEDNESRIGFARLFMQLFAHALGLEFAFHMDDNVSSLYCIDFSKRDQMKMKKTYLTTVLSHLWNQFDPVAELPEELQQSSLSGKVIEYSGKQDKYGVLGMKFDRLGYKRPPFRHGRLGALYLLNVKATFEKKVFFMPTPFLEDVMFCDDCDAKQLLCCKYGRFAFVKAPIEGRDAFVATGVKPSGEPKTPASVRSPVKRASLSVAFGVKPSTEQQRSEVYRAPVKGVDLSAASCVKPFTGPWLKAKKPKRDFIVISDSSDTAVSPQEGDNLGDSTSELLGEETLPLHKCRCHHNSLKKGLGELLKSLTYEYDSFSPCYQHMIKDMSSRHLKKIKRRFEKFEVGKIVDPSERKNLLLFCHLLTTTFYPVGKIRLVFFFN